MKGSADAAAFREYYASVDAEIRTKIYEEILSCEVNGDPDAFERLTVRVLAYVAAGYMLPAQGKACHDLLALIAHSIVARKTTTASLTVTAEVQRALGGVERLKKTVQSKLPDYGDLKTFLGDQPKEPVVIDAGDIPNKPSVRLTPG